MSRDPVKQAWQASVQVAGTPSLEEVRAGASKFYRYVKWRNAVEYVACAVVVASFGSYVFILPHLVQKVGSALVVAAALYTPWQLHRRASAVPPERAGEQPLYAFVRGQLVRQRDALKGVFWWYILPFLPGMALVMVGNALNVQFAAKGPPGWAKWLMFGAVGAVIGGVWWINQRAARKLQKHIDEIDALTRGTE